MNVIQYQNISELQSWSTERDAENRSPDCVECMYMYMHVPFIDVVTRMN